MTMKILLISVEAKNLSNKQFLSSALSVYKEKNLWEENDNDDDDKIKLCYPPTCQIQEHIERDGCI